MKIFSVRAGYQNLRGGDISLSGYQNDASSGLTLGAGIGYDFGNYMFNFDYAYANAGRLGYTQRFTVGLGF